MIDTLNNVFAGTYTLKFITLFVELFLQLIPYALSGVLIVGLVNAFSPRDKLAARLSGRRFLPLLTVSILGAISPVPTYALIPMIASMHKERSVPIGILVAFMISSPLINPLLFVMTYGAFGLPMALMRVAAAVTLGMVGGFIANRFAEKNNNAVQSDAPIVKQSDQNQSWVKRWKTATFKEFKFVLRVFTISVAVAALAGALVPADLFMRIVGGNQTLSVAAAVALGIPLYACGGGAIPVMQVLYESGLSQGAVLAFFISGPGTRLSTIAALSICLSRRISIIYLSVIIIGAFWFGVVYNLVW
ncbi:MAG: permease [Fibrobacteres bacterium]|nr:permease [Fibrobacterota bacterium]